MTGYHANVALLVRAETEVKEYSWSVCLIPREGQPVTVLPPKSSYGSINAVIYSMYYKVVEVAGMQTCFSHPEHSEAACRKKQESIRPLFYG